MSSFSTRVNSCFSFTLSSCVLIDIHLAILRRNIFPLNFIYIHQTCIRYSIYTRNYYDYEWRRIVMSCKMLTLIPIFINLWWTYAHSCRLFGNFDFIYRKNMRSRCLWVKTWRKRLLMIYHGNILVHTLVYYFDVDINNNKDVTHDKEEE